MFKRAFGSSSKTSSDEREARYETQILFEEGSQLAPSFGQLTSETIQEIDNELKIAISGVTRVIAKIPKKERTWEKVIASFGNTTIITQDGEEHYNASKYTKSGTAWLGMGAGVQKGVEQEVIGWFQKLVQDSDVLAATNINIAEVAKIVATTGATIDKLHQEATSNSKSSYCERSIMEIGILRYPQLNEPHFKLYCIKIFAWADFQKGYIGSTNDNGIRGEFRKRKYVPNGKVIGALSATTQQKAVNDANRAFA